MYQEAKPVQKPKQIIKDRRKSMYFPENQITKKERYSDDFSLRRNSSLSPVKPKALEESRSNGQYIVKPEKTEGNETIPKLKIVFETSAAGKNFLN